MLISLCRSNHGFNAANGAPNLTGDRGAFESLRRQILRRIDQLKGDRSIIDVFSGRDDAIRWFKVELDFASESSQRNRSTSSSGCSDVGIGNGAIRWKNRGRLVKSLMFAKVLYFGRRYFVTRLSLQTQIGLINVGSLNLVQGDCASNSAEIHLWPPKS